MNNQLSFAQILQKKKTNELSSISRISTSKQLNQKSNLGSEVNSQYFGSAIPTKLQEMMSQYTEYPERPEQNYILSFSDGNIKQNQDFQSRINPLDSWIMSQSNNINKNKNINLFAKNGRQSMKYSHQKNNTVKLKNKGNCQSTFIFDLNKQYSNIKQNKNQNFDNFLKCTSKNKNQDKDNLREQHCLIKQHFYPQKLTNKQPLKNNNKFIESESYQNSTQHEHDNKQSIKMLLSEQRQTEKKMFIKQQENKTKKQKLSRYQQNYQQTERKDQLDNENSKNKNGEFDVLYNGLGIEGKGKNMEKVSCKKKSLQQQQLLIAGLDETPLLSEQQKRLEDARRQIEEYLQIKDKNTNNKSLLIKQNHHPPTQIKNEIQQKLPEINVKQINYSFANNQITTNNTATESFAHTKQQLKQIVQVNIAEENERMLSCIEYTLSQADGNGESDDAKKQDLNNSRCQLQFPTYKQNLESSQSSPQKKQGSLQNSPCNLQKYLPATYPFETEKQQQCENKFSPQPAINTKNSSLKLSQQIKVQNNKNIKISQDIQYSQIAQKFQSIPQTAHLHINIVSQEKDQWSLNVINSDHSNKFKQLLEGQCLQQTQEQPKTKEVYHDVSSIDIYISESSNQSPPSQKQLTIPIVQNSQNHIQVPKLNLKVSDISSISNLSHPQSNQSHPESNQSHPQYHHQNSKGCTTRQTNIQCYFNDKSLQAESNHPISSHQSINISANASNYGFIYAMRVNSRNSSFTSNYNKSSTSSHGESYCNHNSLYIKEERNINEEHILKIDDHTKQIYNMNKNKQDCKNNIEPDQHQSQITLITEQQLIKLQIGQKTNESTPIIQQSIAMTRIMVNEDKNKYISIENQSINKQINKGWKNQLLSSMSKIQEFEQISVDKENIEECQNGYTLGNQTIIDELKITFESKIKSKEQKLNEIGHLEQRQTFAETKQSSQKFEPTNEIESKKQYCSQQKQQKQIQTISYYQQNVNQEKQTILTPNLQELIRYLKNPISETTNHKWESPIYPIQDNQFKNKEAYNVVQIEQQPKITENTAFCIVEDKVEKEQILSKIQNNIEVLPLQTKQQKNQQAKQIIQQKKEFKVPTSTQTIIALQSSPISTHFNILTASQNKNTLLESEKNQNIIMRCSKDSTINIQGSFYLNQCNTNIKNKEFFEFDMDF